MKSAIRNPKYYSAKRRFAAKHESAFRKRRKAFTLIELMVAISIIILVVATALPTISGLFTAGADQQAFNVLSAQCAAARALAITTGAYAGVHVQMADNPEFAESAGKCYTAIVLYDRENGLFDLAPGYRPQPLPGSYAFGRVSAPYVSSGSYDADTLEDPSGTDANNWSETFAGFTTFTIIFNPAGEVVTNVPRTSFNAYGRIYFDTDPAESSRLFSNSTTATPSEPSLWKPFQDQPGTLAVTLFDYKVLNTMTAADNRKNYLDEYGQFLALNLYTGQFFHRE